MTLHNKDGFLLMLKWWVLGSHSGSFYIKSLLPSEFLETSPFNQQMGKGSGSRSLGEILGSSTLAMNQSVMLTTTYLYARTMRNTVCLTRRKREAIWQRIDKLVTFESECQFQNYKTRFRGNQIKIQADHHSLLWRSVQDIYSVNSLVRDAQWGFLPWNAECC